MPLRGLGDPGSLLDALFQHAPVGVGVWDAELRTVRVNAPLAEILGAPPEACGGRTLAELVGEPGEAAEVVLREVLRTGEPVHGRTVAVRLPDAPERERRFVTSYFPVRDGGGATTGVAGIVQELTAQAEAESERDHLLKEALVARAHAEAAQVRAESAQRDAERARARTGFIAEAGARLATQLDPERAMAELARIAVPAVADWCVISLLDAGDELRPIAAAHADPALEPVVWEIARSWPVAGEAVAGPRAVLRTGRPELRAEVTEDQLRAVAGGEEQIARLRRAGAGSSVVVPLKSPGRRIGTVTLVHGPSGRRFGDEDVAMARSLAARASLHVENARLYTERSRIAETLQEALVPAELPDIPGIDLAVAYRAAGDQNLVGGDFYDVYPSGERTWTAIVGDVSGKGADAAVLTALTRHTLYAGALRDDDPVANLMLLNEALLRRSGAPTRFCTVVTATLEPRPGGGIAVQLANGGHPPPLVLRADGTVEETTARGTLVGALRGLRLVAQDLVLQPGDVLLLFTDGAIELVRHDPEAGAQRLRSCLAGLRGRPAAEVVAALETSVLEAAGGEPRDDVALLAIRATG